ncbi:MAG: M48 family metallopeptidase, partial [Aquabacterium sp.]
MDDTRFTSMVERLEQKAAAHPSRYKTEVLLLAVAGFALLAVVLVIAGLGLAILAGVVLAALFTGGAALLVLLKFGKLLIFLAVPLWFLIKGSIKALLVRLPAPSGLELKRAQAPALFEAIDGMRRTLRGPRIHHVKIVDEVNAAMVQRPLLGMVGPSRNHLLLGLPLLESMTPQEAMAVVAHEYGHLAGAHGRFEAFIYRQRIAWGTIQQLADQWEGRVGRWLATWVGRFAPYFNAYTFVLARANEYQADRASADLVGAAEAQAALKRVNVAGALHGDFMGRTYEGLRTLPEPPADLTLRWADEARGSPALADAAPRGLANALDRRGAPMDTHPPLRQRLAALGDPAVVGTGTAEGTPAASPGAGLADPPVQIE